MLFARHIGGGVRANGKTAQKWLKKYQISKLAKNQLKSGKQLTQRKFHVWGMLGL